MHLFREHIYKGKNPCNDCIERMFLLLRLILFNHKIKWIEFIMIKTTYDVAGCTCNLLVQCLSLSLKTTDIVR